MTLETPFHPRTAELNQARRWRKWSGFFIADSYFPAHDLEYHAIRFSAALFDITPMCKYRVSGPDAAKLVNRVITRRVDRIKPMRAIYTPWCDHDGRVLDDGTVALLADGSYFWTAAEPQHGWLEAAGEGLESGKHSASLQRGSSGVLHGNRTFILQDENGQITETHSISAGLDYPGVGPEHAWLQEIQRAQYVGITDSEALDAFHYLCRTEGIIPALESSHAFAYAMKLAKEMRPDQSILVNLSGRGDKDIGTVADLSGEDFYDRPSMRGHAVKGGPAA